MRDGHLNACKKCINDAARQHRSENIDEIRAKDRARHNPQRRREQQLRYKFGLTKQQHDAILISQGGVCAICRNPCSSGRALAVDHCHDSGAIRGLLCGQCNNGLGRFADDPARLRAAALYLEAQCPTT